MCPIAQELLEEPVCTADGHTYERKVIEAWLQNHNTSPVTGLPLADRSIRPNFAVKIALDAYKEVLVRFGIKPCPNLVSAPLRDLYKTAYGHHFGVPFADVTNERLNTVRMKAEKALKSSNFNFNDNKINPALKAEKKSLESEGIFIDGHKSAVNCAVLSTSTDYILTGSDDKTVRIWSIPERRQVSYKEFASSPIRCLALSKDDRTIALGSDDKSVRVLDFQKTTQTAVFLGHKGRVNSVKFTSDGCFIVSASDDRSIRLWNLTKKYQEAFFLGHQDSINSLSLSSNDSILVSSSFDCTVRIWNLASRKRSPLYENYRIPILSVAIDSNSSLIVSGCYDGSIKLWNFCEHKSQGMLKGHLDAVNAVAIAKCGVIVSGSSDHTIRVWDPQAMKQVAVVERNSYVLAVAIDERAGWIVAVGYDKLVYMCNLRSHLDVELDGHSAEVTVLLRILRKRLVASASLDQTVRVWDIMLKTQRNVFRAHRGAVNCISVNQSETLIASGSDDGSIILWDIESGNLVYACHGPGDRVCTVRFSRSERHVVGIAEEKIFVWSVVRDEINLMQICKE